MDRVIWRSSSRAWEAWYLCRRSKENESVRQPRQEQEQEKKKRGGGDKPARYNSDHRPGDWIGVSLLNCTAHLHESFAVTLKDRWRITIQPFQDADKHMQCPASHLRSPGDAEEGAHACVFVGEW